MPTTIIFKQGSTTPQGSSFAQTIGEPLWQTGGANKLFVTNGTENPTEIAKVVQTVSSGTQIATVGGTAIYAPSVSVSDTLSTGTTVATVTIGGTASTIKVPTVSYSATVTDQTANSYTIGTLTVGSQTFTIYGKDEVGQSGSGREDELTAAAGTTTGTAVLKTNAGSRMVTLTSSSMTFTASDDGQAGDKFITVAITEINGGTWS